MKKNRIGLPLLFTLGLFVATTLLNAQTNELKRSTPEEEGVPSRAIINLFDSLTSLPETEIHSVMVLRHHKVIGEIYPEPFAPEYCHTMYSCSKTFVSAAIGLAIAENRLRLTDRVGSFFVNDLPESISANLADMTIHDLLTMSSGITPDWNMRNIHTDWIRTFLSKPVRTPGKKFEYDSICTYLLSAIIQKTTGMSLLEYLKIKLFTPMNIQEVSWEVSPEGFNTGGWGLYIQTESLAKFGQLILNSGMWEGRQLLPASYIESMTSKQIDTGGDGYGYQTWLCEYPGAVRADGAFGQYILIIPDQEMVVVITECSLTDGRRQRRLVWNNLLPEVKDQPLPPAKETKRLLKKQKSYCLPWAEGRKESSVMQRYNGKEIFLDQNKYGWQSLFLEAKPEKMEITIRNKENESSELSFGYHQWVKTADSTYPPYSIQAKDRFKGIEGPFWKAGSYAWLSPSTLQLKIQYVNWISALGIVLHFEGNDVQLTITENYSRDTVVIKGKLQ